MLSESTMGFTSFLLVYRRLAAHRLVPEGMQMKQILAAVLLAVSLLTSGETVPQKDYYDSGITVRLLENVTILELTLHD